MKNLLTVKGVARILKVKPSTIYQWAEQKQIPCIKLNGSLRFDYSKVLEWIKKNTKKPNAR